MGKRLGVYSQLSWLVTAMEEAYNFSGQYGRCSLSRGGRYADLR